MSQNLFIPYYVTFILSLKTYVCLVKIIIAKLFYYDIINISIPLYLFVTKENINEICKTK